MRLGATQAVKVDDVTLYTNLTWGDLKQIQKQVREMPDDDEGGEAQSAFAEEVLQKYVARVDGLEDVDGNPVTKLTPGVIDSLPPQFVLDAFKQLLSIGDDSGQVDASGNR